MNIYINTIACCAMYRIYFIELIKSHTLNWSKTVNTAFMFVCCCFPNRENMTLNNHKPYSTASLQFF